MAARSKRCRPKSLSARRAWIEIISIRPELGSLWSLSARRAWIEINVHLTFAAHVGVALRKESVDRNTHSAETIKSNVSRSPQGERG